MPHHRQYVNVGSNFMRTFIATLSILVILFSCANKKENKSSENFHLKNKFLGIDSTSIDNQKYFAFCDTNYFFFVLNNKKDTLFRQQELHPDFEFIDFNFDGCNDILINWTSGVPDTKSLILFDKISYDFKQVENFENYPAPNRLSQTDIFYSYVRSGCGDLNWTSELFKVENFAVKKLGYIYAYGCDKNQGYSGININKVTQDEKQVLLEKKPIEILENYKDYKWGFIEKYWTSNYKKFLN